MADVDLVNSLILGGALMVVIGIVSSLIATRFGAPLLLVFLVVGMLAGEEGPIGIEFSNYTVTYMVGSVALAVILFDGGLRTRLSVFRGVLAPSLLLATLGVTITATIAMSRTSCGLMPTTWPNKKRSSPLWPLIWLMTASPLLYWDQSRSVPWIGNLVYGGTFVLLACSFAGRASVPALPSLFPGRKAA